MVWVGGLDIWDLIQNQIAPFVEPEPTPNTPTMYSLPAWQVKKCSLIHKGKWRKVNLPYQQNSLKNGWLEDDRFLLELPFFSGANQDVSFREGTFMSKLKLQKCRQNPPKSSRPASSRFSRSPGGQRYPRLSSMAPSGRKLGGEVMFGWWHVLQGVVGWVITPQKF